MRQVRLLVPILLAGLTGCNALISPLPRAANDPLYYDGSYKGQARLVRSSSPLCPRAQNGVLMIGDDTLTYAYTPDTIFTVPVAANGKLHGQEGNVVLDGQIVGDRMDFVIRSPGCETQYAATFVLNHS